MHSVNCSMYNDLMRADSYEIRVCNSCGLRYPLVGSHAQTFGIRCPACLGETHVALSRALVAETEPTHTSPFGHSAEALPKSDGIGEGQVGKIAVLLDNIRSTWNVGSIFRSADGFGFSHAYVCGITPTPDNEAVQKTSLGAEDAVTWSYHKDAVKLAQGLKKEGWRIFALEENERAVEVRRIDNPTHPTILIVGNEVAGVDLELLNLCDTIYCIPMHGEKRSLNVAIAFGIAAYALR